MANRMLDKDKTFRECEVDQKYGIVVIQKLIIVWCILVVKQIGERCFSMHRIAYRPFTLGVHCFLQKKNRISYLNLQLNVVNREFQLSQFKTF